MKLYNYWRSSASWRVRIALNYKSLPYTYVPVHIVQKDQAAPEYTVKNPMQQVPTLELDDEGRMLHLGQSLAILEYLEERYPEPALLPHDRVARAQCRQIAECINAGIQPFQNLPLFAVYKELGGDPNPLAARFNAAGLAAVEALAVKSAGKFLVGDNVTIADVCLIPQLYSARRFAVDLAPYPTLTRVEATCVAMPAFALSHPDRQPDAPAP